MFWSWPLSQASTIPLTLFLGCAATLGILISGLRSMYIGNSAQSQKLMRARVGMQGLTVLAIAAGGAWTFSAAGDKDGDAAARERERQAGSHAGGAKGCAQTSAFGPV